MASTRSGLLALFLLISLQAEVFCQQVSLQENSGEQPDDGVVEIGDKFSIYCAGYTPTQGTIVFFKYQPEASSKLVLFVAGYSAHPEAGERFEIVTKTNDDGTKTQIMNLKAGAETIDSGMYGCKAVLDPEEKIPREDIPWVTVSVRTPVEEMKLYSINAKDVDDQEPVELVHDESYLVEEDAGFYTKCVASGSNPEPEMTITFNDEDITSSFTKETRVLRPIGDVVPVADVFLNYTYEVTMTANQPLYVTHDDSHRAYTCTAAVQGSPSSSFTVKPYMEYTAEVKCEDVKAKHHQVKAAIRCVVRSEPALDEIRFSYFEQTGNKRELALGESYGTSLVRMVKGEHDDEYVYLLEFKDVPAQAFRKYKFQGWNADGKVRDEATLELEGELLAYSGAPNSIVLGLLSTVLPLITLVASAF